MSTEGVAHANLVGVAAQGDSCRGTAILRVAPRDADDSLLIQKLEYAAPGGAPVCGDPMPAAGDSLHPELIAPIRIWIENGALR